MVTPICRYQLDSDSPTIGPGSMDADPWALGYMPLGPWDLQMGVPWFYFIPIYRVALLIYHIKHMLVAHLTHLQPPQANANGPYFIHGVVSWGIPLTFALRHDTHTHTHTHTLDK